MDHQDDRLCSLVAEQAAEWFVAQSEGALTPRQASEFMHWLRQSPLHVAEYLTLSRVAGEASGAARMDSTSIDELLAGDAHAGVVELNGGAAMVQAATLSPMLFRSRMRRPARTRATSRRHPLRRWTAAVALIAIVGSVLLLARQWALSEPIVASYATLHGQTRTLRLPDQTLVQLDSDSAITVRYGPDSRRVLLDRGQAFFEVASDTGRPFSVAVGQSMIRDIGTAFNVFRNAGGTTVTVAHGRVGVWDMRPDDEDSTDWLAWVRPHQESFGEPVVKLGAGQQVRITRAGQVGWLGTVDIERMLAWRHGKIAFDHEGIAEVAGRFNRYNARQIKVLDPRIAALPISGTFGSHNTAAFVAFLRSLPDVRVEDQGQDLVVVDQSRDRKAR